MSAVIWTYKTEGGHELHRISGAIFDGIPGTFTIETRVPIGTPRNEVLRHIRCERTEIEKVAISIGTGDGA